VSPTVRPGAPTPPGLPRRAALGHMVRGAAGAAAATLLASLGFPDAGYAARPTRKSGGTKAKVTVTVGLYQSTDQPTWKKIMQVAIPLFERSNPDIAIQWLPEPPTTNIQQKLITMYSAGVMPDVIQDCCNDLPVYAAQGMLLDLSPYIAHDWPKDWKSDFLPSQIDAMYMEVPYKAGQFALPTYCGTMGIYYNVDMFRKAKVSLPDASWTFADYAKAFSKLANPGKKQWGAMLPWVDDSRFAAELLNPFGARLVDAHDNTKCAVNTPQGLQAVTWYYDQVYVNKTVVPFNAGHWGSPTFGTLAEQAIFGQGLIACMGEGSWLLSRVVQAVGHNFTWNIAPPPLGPVRRGGLSTTDGYAINSKTTHPEAAWKVLSWMTGPQFSKLLIEIAFLQPARKSLIPYYQQYARAAYPPLKNVDLNAFSDGITEGWATPEQLFRYEAQALTAYQAVMTQSLWSVSTTWTPKEIVTQLQTQIDASQQQAAAGVP
jgi:multiple sugar transport system substrate-binding protein